MSTQLCSHLMNLDIGAILKGRLLSQKSQRLQCQGKIQTSEKEKSTAFNHSHAIYNV